LTVRDALPHIIAKAFAADRLSLCAREDETIRAGREAPDVL
jgi:hypothetical protein